MTVQTVLDGLGLEIDSLSYETIQDSLGRWSGFVSSRTKQDGLETGWSGIYLTFFSAFLWDFLPVVGPTER